MIKEKKKPLKDKKKPRKPPLRYLILAIQQPKEIFLESNIEYDTVYDG
jgi:hypothetical protein